MRTKHTRHPGRPGSVGEGKAADTVLVRDCARRSHADGRKGDMKTVGSSTRLQPQRLRPTDHRAGRDGAEVAAVEGLRVGGAEQEEFIANQASAGLPGRQRPTLSILVQAPGDNPPVDQHLVTPYADVLRRDGSNGLQQRHIRR
ncbi:hypothetical protein FQZ97_1017510 [compost metagenome]